MVRVEVGAGLRALILQGNTGKKISAMHPFVVGFPTTLKAVFGDEQTVCVNEIEFKLFPWQYMEEDRLIMDVPPRLTYKVGPYSCSFDPSPYYPYLPKDLPIYHQMWSGELKDYIIITPNSSEEE